MRSIILVVILAALPCAAVGVPHSDDITSDDEMSVMLSAEPGAERVPIPESCNLDYRLDYTVVPYPDGMMLYSLGEGGKVADILAMKFTNDDSSTALSEWGRACGARFDCSSEGILADWFRGKRKARSKAYLDEVKAHIEGELVEAFRSMRLVAQNAENCDAAFDALAEDKGADFGDIESEGVMVHSTRSFLSDLAPADLEKLAVCEGLSGEVRRVLGPVRATKTLSISAYIKKQSSPRTKNRIVSRTPASTDETLYGTDPVHGRFKCANARAMELFLSSQHRFVENKGRSPTFEEFHQLALLAGKDGGCGSLEIGRR